MNRVPPPPNPTRDMRIQRTLDTLQAIEAAVESVTPLDEREARINQAVQLYSALAIADSAR
jgi:hypothetical protein